jgi:hypothetical protein
MRAHPTVTIALGGVGVPGSQAYGVVVVPLFADPPVLAGRRLLQTAVAFVNVELDGEVEPNVTPWDLRHAVYFANAGFACPRFAPPPPKPRPPAGRLL